MTDLTKPSPKQARAEYKKGLTELKGAVQAEITAADASLSEAMKSLTLKESEKFGTAESARNAMLEASAQRVAAKAAEVEEARKALEAAEAALKTTAQEHKATARSLSQIFSQVAGDIRASVAEEALAADEARQAVIDAGQKKVAEAKSAGRSAVLAETKALVDYKVFVVKSQVKRRVHAVKAVKNALTTAYNAGFNEDPGVELPASLAARQKKAETAQPQA